MMDSESKILFCFVSSCPIDGYTYFLSVSFAANLAQH